MARVFYVKKTLKNRLDLMEDIVTRVANGDIVEGKICDFASGGEGVLKMGAYPIFVPFAIKGEQVRARVVLAKKDYAFGELIDILTPSNDRIKPLCPYFEKCGGCDLQHMSAPLQQQLKCDSVRLALKKNANIDVDVPLPIRLNDWEYRNKLSLPFFQNKRSGRVSVGFFEKRTHKVVPMKWCPLHAQWAAELIECVCEWANECKISVYDEQTKKGVLRHVVARKLDSLSVTLVINAQRVDHLGELAKKLEEKFDDFVLYISANTTHSNVIMGESVKLVWGRQKPQNLGAFSAEVSPLSFLQVNDKVRDAIYDDVCQKLEGFEGDIVELYSGVGLLTAQIAKRLENAHITAVEIVPSAVDTANALAKKLGIANRVTSVCDDALHYIKTLTSEQDKPKPPQSEPPISTILLKSPLYLGSFDDDIPVADKPKALALVLDPPRRGCDKDVLIAAIKAGFEKIIYISCNPQTLARDLKILLEGYNLTYVQPYDMFPQTSNVETVVTLQKIDKSL